jgi:predicted transcriptional regulator
MEHMYSQIQSQDYQSQAYQSQAYQTQAYQTQAYQLSCILCMILCINAFIAFDYARFRVQCRNKDARNEFTRSTTLHNHAAFIEFKEHTNKAIKELEETCVKVMHSQNAITNGLKEVETTINANVAILSEAQTIVAAGLKEVDRNIRDIVCMQVDLAATQNELATTQNQLDDVQKSLAAANSETRRLQVDMFGIQNTFSNRLKEVERHVREMVHAQIDFTTAQNRLETDIKEMGHVARAQRERMDAKDIVDKALSNELCDLNEEMNDLHDQQNVKITENAVHIAELAARCKGLVEQEKRNIQRALDMYRYWKTANDLYQGNSIITVIDGMFKQYYNFVFNKNLDYIKDITDATLPSFPSTELFSGI